MPLSKIDSDSLSAPLTVPAGSAAAPAITTTGDTNTGIFFPAADTIAFAEGGVEAARFDASGNLGIGTTSPATMLDVRGEVSVAYSATYGIRFYNQDRNNWSSIGCNIATGTATANLVFQDSSGEVARITGGNLLVGTTTRFTTGGFQPKVTIDAGSDGIAIPNIGNGYSGVVTKAGGAHNYTAGYFLNSSNNAVGSISCTTSATSYVTSSDYRLKHDIQPMTGALAKVAALKPVTYKWNADNSESQGFIAHELAEVCPDAVCGEKDAVDGNGGIKPQGIDTSFLVATLTAAIQELKAIVDAQGAEIAALKGTP